MQPPARISALTLACAVLTLVIPERAATLTADNTYQTYQGGTTITAGELVLGDNGTTGSILGDVTNNGQLTFSRSDTCTFGALISGNGGVGQAGSGTTVLTATNTYTGPTTINGGTLGRTGTVGTTLATSYSGQIGDDTGDRGASVTLGAVLTRE